MLELMHFSTELIDIDEFKVPSTQKVTKQELQMAQALVASMSAEWNPEEYVDEYRDALEKVVEEKIRKGDKAAPKPVKKVKPTNVVDLVAVLQKSLDQTGNGTKKKPKQAAAVSSKKRRKAA